MKKIALIPNRSKSASLRCALKAAVLLSAAGAEVAFDREIVKFLPECAIYPTVPLERLYAESDAVVVFGGDGTVLGAAVRAAEAGVPVCGVNFGHVGYIAELEEGEIGELCRLASGDFDVENRLLLDIEIKKRDRRLFFARAFNEVTVTRGVITRLVDFDVSCNGTAVCHYRADGLIVATPTGSTAYSMAAGGPVIDPKLSLIAVTPVCSHSLDSGRSIVFGADSEISVKVPSAKRSEAVVTVDGRSCFRINDCDTEVFVRRSDKCVQMLKFKDDLFCNTLYKKFGSDRSN